MITGEKAFERESGADTLAAILTEEPRPLAEFNAPAPNELQRIVSLTLQKKKSDRYQTPNDLLRDLRALKQELEFRERGRAKG
jgi:hypothetical protein